MGSLIHIFWSCPWLRPFWDDIISLITEITQYSCPQSPEFLLLLIRIDSFPLNYRTVICNILHTARLTIARNWKSTVISTLVEFNNIVSTLCVFERTLTGYRGLQHFFPKKVESPGCIYYPTSLNFIFLTTAQC